MLNVLMAASPATVTACRGKPEMHAEDTFKMNLKDLFPNRAVITVDELADAAGVTRWLVDRDIREGHLKAVVVGSKAKPGSKQNVKRIPIDAAQQWLLGTAYPTNAA
jgi:hypothetical protein